MSHVIHPDDVQIRENLTYDKSYLQIEYRKVKDLKGK